MNRPIFDSKGNRIDTLRIANILGANKVYAILMRPIRRELDIELYKQVFILKTSAEERAHKLEVLNNFELTAEVIEMEVKK